MLTLHFIWLIINPFLAKIFRDGLELYACGLHTLKPQRRPTRQVIFIDLEHSSWNSEIVKIWFYVKSEWHKILLHIFTMYETMSWEHCLYLIPKYSLNLIITQCGNYWNSFSHSFLTKIREINVLVFTKQSIFPHLQSNSTIFPLCRINLKFLNCNIAVWKFQEFPTTSFYVKTKSSFIRDLLGQKLPF